MKGVPYHAQFLPEPVHMDQLIAEVTGPAHFCGKGFKCTCLPRCPSPLGLCTERRENLTVWMGGRIRGLELYLLLTQRKEGMTRTNLKDSALYCDGHSLTLLTMGI